MLRLPRLDSITCEELEREIVRQMIDKPGSVIVEVYQNRTIKTVSTCEEYRLALGDAIGELALGAIADAIGPDDACQLGVATRDHDGPVAGT